MKIQLNGETVELPNSISVAALLELREINQRYLAVEVNGEVVPRARHGELLLCDGDRLEVVSLVGGG
ncbi:MAG: sulfur carrier protein ThiS [Planctomycetales bacterium]|nr:sulfur carrier protein ThiS [Planctomycetales bacterium]